MSSKQHKQGDIGCGGSPHQWQPLFHSSATEEYQRVYVAKRHADYLQCAQCRAVVLRDSPSLSTVLNLSQSFSDSKRREAELWNNQQRAAERFDADTGQ